MSDVLTAIWTLVLNFFQTFAVFDVLPEFAGILAIFALMGIFRKIRKRGKKSAAGDAGPEPESFPETAEEPEREPDENVETAKAACADAKPVHDREIRVVEAPYPEPAPPSVSAKPGAKADGSKVRKPVAPERTAEPVSFLGRLKSGLSKTRKSLSQRFDAILSGTRTIDGETLEEIEEILITADMGVPTTMALMDRIGQNSDGISSAEDFKALLKREMLALVNIEAPKPDLSEKPHVIMVIGVNGVGKTTTIGKLAAKFSAQGKKVLLAAADTFRAAAAEQLEIWAQRANAEIVRHRDKSDPAAVAFDSIEAALARKIDVVIVDTAGRLHTKVNLMEELKKIKRSIAKKLPAAPHETLLVLDATTGQNAVSQAKLFHESIPVSGIILTKLDGTAKGGIVIGICDTLKIPIRYIGIGEGVEDLQEFDPAMFVDAIL